MWTGRMPPPKACVTRGLAETRLPRAVVPQGEVSSLAQVSSSLQQLWWPGAQAGVGHTHHQWPGLWSSGSQGSAKGSAGCFQP